MCEIMLVPDYHVSPLSWQFIVYIFCNLLLCADLRPQQANVTTSYASSACTGIDHSNNLSLIIAWVMIFITFINLWPAGYFKDTLKP